MKKSLFVFFTLLTISNIFSQTPYPTRLTNTYCYNYNLPLLYSNFVAIKKPCDGYKYYVENQTTLELDSLVTYGRVAGRITNLSNFPGANIQYGTTYKVSVRTWIGSSSNISAPAAVDCFVLTPPIPTTKIQDSQCDAVLSEIYTPIYADNVSGAEAYTFELTNLSTSEVQEYEKTVPTLRAFSLANFPTSFVTYNTTYEVRVKVKCNGTYGSYGTICNISTPCGSELEEAESGTTINYLHYDAIFATPSNCTNVQDYQFRYRIGDFPSTTSPYVIATGGTEATENAGDLSVFLSDFGPITNFPNSNPYGKTYRISVRVKADGVWGPWGKEKIVYTPANPTVKLRDGEYPVAGANQCGSSFNSPYIITSSSSILAAYNLYGFLNYTFEVTELDGSGNDIVTKFLTREASDFGSMSRAFRLNMIEASSPAGTDGYWAGTNNTTFRVRVKTNLGNYGEACYIRIQSSGMITSTKPYPNPFNSTFSLKTESNSKVEIYNMSGQLVESSFQTRNLGENLPTGIYFIKFNGETIKVIKE